MNLKDFNTLEEAQAYEVVETRMVTPGVMLGLITKFGITEKLLVNPTTNEAHGVKLAFNFGSEFNFIEGHPANMITELQKLVDDNIVPQALQSILLSLASKVTKPYENVTKEDFDKAKRNNPTQAMSVSYLHGESGYHVTTNPIVFTVRATEPVLQDTTIDIKEHPVVNEELKEFTDVGNLVARVVLPKGTKYATANLKTTSKILTKFSGTSDYEVMFTVEVATSGR